MEEKKDAVEAEEKACQRCKADAEIEARAHQKLTEQLKTEKEAHTLRLQVLEKQMDQPQPVGIFLLNSKEWHKACLIYQESNCIAEFLFIFKRLCDIHKIPGDKWMPIL